MAHNEAPNDADAEHIGPAVFDDTPAGNMRRYWFVSGVAGGILGVGMMQHGGAPTPSIALILLGGALVIALRTVKKWRGWDV